MKFLFLFALSVCVCRVSYASTENRTVVTDAIKKIQEDLILSMSTFGKFRNATIFSLNRNKFDNEEYHDSSNAIVKDAWKEETDAFIRENRGEKILSCVEGVKETYSRISFPIDLRFYERECPDIIELLNLQYASITSDSELVTFLHEQVLMIINRSIRSCKSRYKCSSRQAGKANAYVKILKDVMFQSEKMSIELSNQYDEAITPCFERVDSRKDQEISEFKGAIAKCIATN